MCPRERDRNGAGVPRLGCSIPRACRRPVSSPATRLYILGKRKTIKRNCSLCELLGMDANVPTDIRFSFAGLMQRGGATGLDFSNAPIYRSGDATGET